MSNPLHPDKMASDERIAELAAILAAGAIRLLDPQSSEEFPLFGESSLDFGGEQSGGGQTNKGSQA